MDENGIVVSGCATWNLLNHSNGLVMVFEASSSLNRELHTFQISIFKSLPLHAYDPATLSNLMSI